MAPIRSPSESVPADDLSGQFPNHGLPAVLLRLDEQGRILWLSGALFEKSVGQATGTCFAKQFLPQHRDAIRSALNDDIAVFRKLSVRDPSSLRRLTLFLRRSSTQSEAAVFAVLQPHPRDVAGVAAGTKMLPVKQDLPALHRTVNRSSLLIADDDPALRKLMREILETRKYSVLTAADGDQCSDALKRFGDSIGLVILDLGMPGRTCAALFKQINGLPNPPAVLVVTGYTELEVQTTLETSEGWVLLRKPFTNTELARHAERLLPSPVTEANN